MNLNELLVSQWIERLKSRGLHGEAYTLDQLMIGIRTELWNLTQEHKNFMKDQVGKDLSDHERNQNNRKYLIRKKIGEFVDKVWNERKAELSNPDGILLGR